MPCSIIFFIATSPTLVQAPVAKGAILFGINLVIISARAHRNYQF